MIAQIDWTALSSAAATRLRAFGFEDGAKIETLHFGGIFAKDPISFRIGRMTIALRRDQAARVTVTAL